MGVAVVTGAACVCSFGTAPCRLKVTSQQKLLADGKPVATIQDMQYGINLRSFGMCSSLANPAVASATAAALGVLTPQPCTMAPMGTWLGCDSKNLADGKPVLTNEATLRCSLGMGTIGVVDPGQTKVMF